MCSTETFVYPIPSPSFDVWLDTFSNRTVHNRQVSFPTVLHQCGLEQRTGPVTIDGHKLLARCSAYIRARSTTSPEPLYPPMAWTAGSSMAPAPWPAVEPLYQPLAGMSYRDLFPAAAAPAQIFHSDRYTVEAFQLPDIVTPQSEDSLAFMPSMPDPSLWTSSISDSSTMRQE